MTGLHGGECGRTGHPAAARRLLVQFLELDLKTPLPRKLTFVGPEKIRELAERGEAWRAGRTWEHAIETGRGGVYLRLSPEHMQS